jgi:hypothetical protein
MVAIIIFLILLVAGLAVFRPEALSGNALTMDSRLRIKRSESNFDKARAKRRFFKPTYSRWRYAVVPCKWRRILWRLSWGSLTH